MNETISVEQTAKLLGKSPQFVRVQIQRGLLPFGNAFPSVTGNKLRYVIPKRKVYEYLGIEVKENE